MKLHRSLFLLLGSLFPISLLASPFEHTMVVLSDPEEAVYLEYPQFKEAWLNEMIEEHSLRWYHDLVNFKTRKPASCSRRLFSDKIDVLYQSDNVIVLESYTEERDEDNMEAEAFKSYKNIDLRRQRELSLTDVFKPIMIDQMMSYGEKIFRVQFGLSEEDSLVRPGYYFENGFRLPKAFALTKDGVRFTYNHTELEPFGEQLFDLLIPYQILVKCDSEVRPLREWVDLSD